MRIIIRNELDVRKDNVHCNPGKSIIKATGWQRGRTWLTRLKSVEIEKKVSYLRQNPMEHFIRRGQGLPPGLV